MIPHHCNLLAAPCDTTSAPCGGCWGAPHPARYGGGPIQGWLLGILGKITYYIALACSHASINPRSTSSSTNIYAVSQEAGLVYIACIAHARVMGGRIARNIRACAIDVDGTLMNSAGVITPATIAVLQRERAQVLRRGRAGRST